MYARENVSFLPYLDQMLEWADVLNDRNILWGDFKASNVMARRHQMVISDLGASRVSKINIPMLLV